MWQDDCGLHVIRLDLVEHNDNINDRIIADIRRAEVLVADFTYHKGGVYFEAGFALGLDRTVVFTCRKDQFREGQGVHFDTRPYNHILWEANNVDVFRERLASGSTTGIGLRSGLKRAMSTRFAARITTLDDGGDEATTMIPTNRTPTHPGEILLEEFLNPLGMTQTTAAQKMGISLNRLNELINGNRGITAETALRLAKLLNTTPEFWMNLQTTWDLYHAQREFVSV